MSWFLLGFRRWSDFGGRASRLEYVAFVYPVYVLVFAAVRTLEAVYPAVDGKSGWPGWALFAFAAAFLAISVPIWSVSTRRLHDFGVPGGLLVLGAFIPGLNLLFLLLLSVFPGTRGENRYGDEAGVPSDYLGKL